ncbi:MAG TPA: YlaF family protein [Bacillaceae bacterium]
MGIKWNFLILAILAAISIIGIGVMLGERSIVGMVIFFLILMAVMGYGFASKKKMRDQGKL